MIFQRVSPGLPDAVPYRHPIVVQHLLETASRQRTAVGHGRRRSGVLQELDEHGAQRWIRGALLDVRGPFPGRRQVADLGHPLPLGTVRLGDEPSAANVVGADLIVWMAMHGRRLPLRPDDVPYDDLARFKQL